MYPSILHRFALCVTTFVHLICWVNFSTTQCLLLIIMDATCFDILDNFLSHPFPEGVIDGDDPLLLGDNLKAKGMPCLKLFHLCVKFSSYPKTLSLHVNGNATISCMNHDASFWMGDLWPQNEIGSQFKNSSCATKSLKILNQNNILRKEY